MHLQTSADLGFLMNPGEGAVAAVAFFTPERAAAPSHLLSGAADGTIAVWAVGGDWDCLKLLKGHKCGCSPLYAGPRSPLSCPADGEIFISLSQFPVTRKWQCSPKGLLSTRMHGTQKGISTMVNPGVLLV